MDIDLLHNNHMYYDGFEGEEEVEITLINDQSLSIHFWIGYMDDILSNPDLQGKGWAGFTKALFSNDPTPDNCYDPHEYLHDIKQYQDADFNEEESHLVLQLIITFLEYAISVGSKIIIQVH